MTNEALFMECAVNEGVAVPIHVNLGDKVVGNAPCCPGINRCV